MAAICAMQIEFIFHLGYTDISVADYFCFLLPHYEQWLAVAKISSGFLFVFVETCIYFIMFKMAGFAKMSRTDGI